MEKQREKGENCQVQQGRSRRQRDAVPNRDVSHSFRTGQAAKGAGVLAAEQELLSPAMETEPTASSSSHRHGLVWFKPCP